MDELARPEKSLEREIRAYHWIRLLAELSGRFAGTDQEGEAARRVESWLRDLGFDEIGFASVASRARTGWAWAAHFVLAALGCALGGVAGAVLAGVAALSFRREAGGGAPLLSRLFPARDSQNVTARVGSIRPRRRVVLTAPLDAAPASELFAGRLAAFGASSRAGRPPRGLAALPTLLLDASAIVSAAAALGAEGTLALVARAVAGGLLAIGAIAAARWATASGSAGANDASGVAAMLSAAEQLAAQLPPDVELWCAATGAEHTGARGMHALLEAHPEWRAENTAFVNFAWVGGGALHYAISEGELARTHYDTSLLELARRVAASGSYGAVTPADLAFDTAARLAARRGPHVLSLVALEPDRLPRGFRARGDDPAQIDTELVVRAADFGSCVVSAYLRGDAEPLAYV
ncbi:MAG: Zn-dependent exopeptidase M28 [Deltaproteobacteria bacterium]|nr:MAG: Zn-dependent exopeptidase M28 [Deltaproteobacteria bacterium]